MGVGAAAPRRVPVEASATLPAQARIPRASDGHNNQVRRPPGPPARGNDEDIHG